MLDQREEEEARRAASLRAAETKTRAFFEEVARDLLRPGVTESEVSREIHALGAERHGVRSYWHKRIVRSGPNTLQPYAENPPDRVLRAGDILFVDLGPVFEEWEADFGRTYVLGGGAASGGGSNGVDYNNNNIIISSRNNGGDDESNNCGGAEDNNDDDDNDDDDDDMKAAKLKLCDALEPMWHDVKATFDRSPNMTGEELYAVACESAKRAGYDYGGPLAGHLVGNFPHERIPKDKVSLYIIEGNKTAMRSVGKDGYRRHWILEIHLVDRERQIGGFFEQLLTVD